MILINLHRTAAPADHFYAATMQLPVGGLSAEYLERVKVSETRENIVEKSQTGHLV